MDLWYPTGGQSGTAYKADGKINSAQFVSVEANDTTDPHRLRCYPTSLTRLDTHQANRSSHSARRLEQILVTSNDERRDQTMTRSEDQHFAIPDDMPALQSREPRTRTDNDHVGQRVSSTPQTRRLWPSRRHDSFGVSIVG